MEEAQQSPTQPGAEENAPVSDPSALGDPAGPAELQREQASALSPVMVYARAMLNDQIARLTRQGYVIVSQTETSAQLRRRKHFSVWWALFWLIVGAGVGLLVYVAWYVLIKRDRVAFIRITPEGRVMLTEN